MKHVFFFFAAVLATIPAHSQLWLDPTFGTGGLVSQSFAPDFDAASCMAVQADGKIVIAGTLAATSSTADFMLARFEANGALDTGFGNGGMVTHDVAAYDVAYDIALQADGRIVVVGTSQGAGTDKVVLRFTASGQIDPSFNGTGELIIDDSYQEDQLYGVAIQADQRIVAVGQGFNGSKDVFYLCRINSDGTFDTGFGSGGQIEHTITGDNCHANDVAIMADGRIVSAGTSYSNTTTQFDAVAVRYLADGTFDDSFADQGIEVLAWSAFDDAAYAVRVQADGKVLVGGAQALNAADTRVVVARLLESGLPDMAFGVNGTTRTFTGSQQTRCASLGLSAGGDILVGGTASTGSDRRSYLCRLSGADGNLDATFGTGGELFHPETGPSEETPALAVQPDGKVLVAGYGGTINAIDTRILRYLPTPVTGLPDVPGTAPIRLLQADAAGVDLLLTAPTPIAFDVLDSKGAIVASRAVPVQLPGITHITLGTTLEPGAYAIILRTSADAVTGRFVIAR